MTGPGKRLMVVTAACVLIGLAAVVAAWRDPDGGFTVLATAAGWPWAWQPVEEVRLRIRPVQAAWR